jgi:hypothetical protein
MEKSAERAASRVVPGAGKAAEQLKRQNPVKRTRLWSGESPDQVVAISAGIAGKSDQGPEIASAAVLALDVVTKFMGAGVQQRLVLRGRGRVVLPADGRAPEPPPQPGCELPTGGTDVPRHGAVPPPGPVLPSLGRTIGRADSEDRPQTWLALRRVRPEGSDDSELSRRARLSTATRRSVL